MKIQRVRLRDLQPISQEEFEQAVRICEQIRTIQAQRTAYVEQHGLDPDIAFPAENWSEMVRHDFLALYRFIAESPRYETINRLKFYTQFFTGYQLMTLSFASDQTNITHIPDNVEEMLDAQNSQPDEWVERHLYMQEKTPDDLLIRVPKKMGEIGWDVGGYLVNHDVSVYQERLNLLYDAGLIDELRYRIKLKGSVNILEIGGGYGGLAYFIKQVLPQVNYFICDLPESLLFSSLYLGLNCPDVQHTLYNGSNSEELTKNNWGFKYIPNYMFDEFAEQNLDFDIAINTLSFSEMSEKQVRHYADRLKKLLGNVGALFEQNQDNKALGLINCKDYLPDYFANRRVVPYMTVYGYTQGIPEVWTNEELKIHQAGVEINELKKKVRREKSTIVAMKSSKFWKMRMAWFRIKESIGLPVDDKDPEQNYE